MRACVRVCVRARVRACACVVDRPGKTVGMNGCGVVGTFPTPVKSSDDQKSMFDIRFVGTIQKIVVLHCWKFQNQY